MSEETMRDEFEVWYESTYQEHADNGYAAGDWASWQAACAHKESEFSKEREQLRALIAMPGGGAC